MDSVKNSQAPISGIGKHLSPAEVLALALGCSVGWGSFVLPSTVFLKQSGAAGTVIGLLIGAVFMLVIGKNYYYMLNKFPDDGGTFTYTKSVFGGDHGFLCAWFLCLAYFSIIWANSTALSLLTRSMFGSVLQFGFHYSLAGYDIYFGEVLLCIAAVVLAAGLSLLGKRAAAITETVLSGILFCGIIFLFAATVSNGGVRVLPGSLQSAAPTQIFFTLAHVPWAFVGFESVSHFVGEYSFSSKKTFRIIVLAVMMIAVCYILLAFVPVFATPDGSSNFAHSIPTFSEKYGALGKPIFIVLGVTIFAAIFTGILGITTTLSRLLYSISRDNEQFRFFGKLSRREVPVNAVLFIAAVSSLIPSLGRTALGWCIDVCTIGSTAAYAYTSAAAFKTAKKDGDSSTSITGAVGVVVSILFSIFLLIPKTAAGGTLEKESYLILSVWCIIGFALFLFLFKNDRGDRFGHSLIVWIALLTLIFFTSVMWIYETTKATAVDAAHNIGEFYTEEFERTGITQDMAHELGQAPRLHTEIDRINRTLLIGIAVQSGLMMLSLMILMSVYSIMRKRENEMQVAKALAEEHSKAKSFFLSNMSHDLRTPLNAVIGYTDLALKDDVSESELRDYLEKIRGSGKHLLDLIDDVLEMSRIESGKIELESVPADLVKIMDSVRNVFVNQAAERHISFTVDTSGLRDRYVMCDRKRLNRVLINLSGNACKFTPEGGAVGVKLLQLGSENGIASYRLHVKDNGIGMSEEFVGKVFDAFERERTSTASGIQGTGLGLAITKNIVDLMNGTIKIETAPNVGTEFIVDLSFPITEKIEDEKEKKKTEARNFKGRRILLAEDILINREIAKKLLTSAGFLVETAENGKIVVDMVKASEPGYYDVVLMDVQMPVMGGLEATKLIRAFDNKQLADIPIIAMTANVFAEDIEAEKASGMNGHISKPIDAQNVLDTLGEVLDA